MVLILTIENKFRSISDQKYNYNDFKKYILRSRNLSSYGVCYTDNYELGISNRDVGQVNYHGYNTVMVRFEETLDF